MNKLAEILIDLEHHNITFDEAYPQILSLMGENESGVSDSHASIDALHDVRKSGCEAIESDKLTGES